MKVSENSADTWYSLLSSSKEISGLEYNTKLEWRDKRPNDPRVNEQWYLENIKAFEAWNITTGGPTENGKEFVIAVIDDGFLTNHEDFADIFLSIIMKSLMMEKIMMATAILMIIPATM